MRIFHIPIALGLLFMAGWCHAEMLTWTDKNGKSVEGEFVRLVGTTVTIKNTSGRNFAVPFSQLSEESINQAKKLGEAQAPAVAATPSTTDAKPAAETKPAPALPPKKPAGVPTDEEIAAFVTEVKISETESIVLNARFSVPSLKPDAIRDYTRKKKVPYRLTVELDRVKMVDGRRRFVSMNGNAYFVILNEAGDVMARKREALAKLCPS